MSQAKGNDLVPAEQTTGPDMPDQLEDETAATLALVAKELEAHGASRLQGMIGVVQHRQLTFALVAEGSPDPLAFDPLSEIVLIYPSVNPRAPLRFSLGMRVTGRVDWLPTAACGARGKTALPPSSPRMERSSMSVSRTAG
ncbi:hypothetical protein [Sphingomonas sp. M1-B02]|uniref:hypothetical protein n=1 Tax=Sphingomonas sp. M1-B02 TaxID=3114300 RepID=UPI002240B70E|nr:hypothetical protein [Sphingomonas sp. S6-11]UZK67845.1 hypothetical protein OKW87_08500 [Sphingomonas sp. S6-11]